jgi:hypothetical protein
MQDKIPLIKIYESISYKKELIEKVELEENEDDLND